MEVCRSLNFEFRIGLYEKIPSPTEEDRPIKEVELSSLSNNQEVVGKEKIDSMMKLGLDKIGNLEDTESTGLPYVIHYGDTNMIMDGHHRLTAIKALGGKTARVRYFDLEDYMKKR